MHALTSTHCMAPVRDTEHATPAAKIWSTAHAPTHVERVIWMAALLTATHPNNATKPRLVSEANWLR
jgi:hypothetical protein